MIYFSEIEPPPGILQLKIWDWAALLKEYAGKINEDLRLR